MPKRMIRRMNRVNLNNYDVIIFDCDGVLIDVNDKKAEAFGKAVNGYPQPVIDSFVDYCKNSFGESRYVKFNKFFEEFLKEEFDEEKYNIFLTRYATECKNIYMNAPLTPGCWDILKALKARGKHLYVASGSDERELNEVLNKKGIKKYFNRIFGSPRTKKEAVGSIFQNHAAKRIVLIGDALSDMETSKSCDTNFIYMKKYSIHSRENHILCQKEATYEIQDLRGLTI